MNCWKSFPELRRDLIPLAVAACLTETAGEIVGAIDNLPELFGALAKLAGAIGCWFAHPVPVIKLSHPPFVSGRASDRVGSPVRSAGKQTDGVVWFSLNKGGIICQPCLGQSQGERLYPLHLGSRKLILAAHRLPLENLARLRFPELAQRETLAILQALYPLHIRQRIKII